MDPVKVNPLDVDKDILGKTYVVTQCEGRMHDKKDHGCVCRFIGRKVTLIKRHESPWTGTVSYHIKGSKKTVRLSELGLPNRYQ